MRTILTSRRPYGPGRMTAQRQLIAGAVPPRAFTVAELAGIVASIDERIGLATVYRAVTAMERSGWLTRVGDSEGCALYAHCDGDEHHHHAVCTRCGRVEHLPCPLDAAPLADAGAGFRVTQHEITLYGLCARCDGRRAVGGDAA